MRLIIYALLLANLALTNCGKDDKSPLIPSGKGLITIHNQSQRPIHWVAFDGCTWTTSGPNRLEKELPAGESQDFQVEPGCWDVWAVSQTFIPGSTHIQFTWWDVNIEVGEHITLRTNFAK